MTLPRPPPASSARCSRPPALHCRPTSASQTQPDHPAQPISCDANNHARSRKRLNQNTFLKLGVQVEPKEVERLIAAARQNWYGHRDATMILIAYRHGLRVSELCALRWDQVDFEHGLLHVQRIKNGAPSVHPLGEGVTRATQAPARGEARSTGGWLAFKGSHGSSAGRSGD